MKLVYEKMTRNNLLELMDVSKRWMPYVGMLPGVLQSWNTDEDYQIARIGDSVVVKGRSMMDRNVDGIVYTSPIIDNDSLEIFHKLISTGQLEKIDNIGIKSNSLLNLMENLPVINISPNIDESEYLYSVSELNQMKGNSKEKIRYKVNKFKRLYERKYEIIVTESLTPELKKHVYRLYDDWLDFETDGSNHQPEIELEALRRTLEDSKFNEFGVYKYLLCYIDNKLVGFSSFMIIDDFAAGFFIKNNLNISCISEWMVHNVAKYLDSVGVKTLNIMEDAGITGLRSFKQGLGPKGFAKVYSIKKV